jgi:hypothetical protein
MQKNVKDHDRITGLTRKVVVVVIDRLLSEPHHA